MDLSDFSIKREQCSRCGAVWLDKQHYWVTGKKGQEIDLAGLVCNQANSNQCINPKKGQQGGDTWSKRLKFLEILELRDNPIGDAGIYGLD